MNDLDRIAVKLTTQRTQCTKLNAPFAFYSLQIDAIPTDFEDISQAVAFQKPQLPVISPLLSNILSEADSVTANYLARYTRKIVDFQVDLWQHTNLVCSMIRRFL